jgi:magnesium-transporting ATPase (P-type)
MAKGYHTGLVAEWAKNLNSDLERGLTNSEAHRRVVEQGENRISAKTKRSKLELLGRAVQEPARAVARGGFCHCRSYSARSMTALVL